MLALRFWSLTGYWVMSEKGVYKKANGPGWDYDPDNKRAKENKFFEKTASDKVASRKKSKKKGKPRADHKHEYKSVLIWWKSSWRQEIYSRVASRCVICGSVTYSYREYREEKKYLGELQHFWEDEKECLIPISATQYQKTIFLGGSKLCNTLTIDVKNEIVQMMNCNHKILIGDDIGADLQMQKFLQENGYRDVVVYYSGNRPRINLGGWKEKYIPVNKYASGYEMQRCRDEQMITDCDAGFMVMKGKTCGTVANIERLLANKKKCKVRFYRKREIEPLCATTRLIDNENDFKILFSWLEC